MNTTTNDVMRRYLLGLADPESREDLDKRLFSEDQVFWERLTIAEDELVDDFAAGVLSDEEGAAFTSTFLCSEERRAKLGFARAIREYARERQPDRRGVRTWLRAPAAIPRWALAAAALLVVALIPALIWRAAPGSRPQAALSVSLTPGLLRDAGAGLVRIDLPPGCEVVHLDLVTGFDAYATYSATVHEVGGEAIWSQHKLTAVVRDGSITVRLSLPCGILPEDDYWVRLSGVTPGQEPAPLDRYDFRVLRE
jgi:hypothetical protein